MASILNTAEALASLAQFKKYLAIDPEDELLEEISAYDEELERVLNAVGSLFKKYTNRNLISAARTQYLDGDGSAVLRVDSYPITSTASTIEIYVDTDREYPASSKIDSDAIAIYGDLGKIKLDDTVFSKGIQSVKLVYTGGYTLTTGEDHTIPSDLQYAALIQGAFIWKNRKDNMFGVTSLSIAGQSQSLSEKSMPDLVRDILDIGYVRHPREFSAA